MSDQEHLLLAASGGSGKVYRLLYLREKGDNMWAAQIVEAIRQAGVHGLEVHSAHDLVQDGVPSNDFVRFNVWAWHWPSRTVLHITGYWSPIFGLFETDDAENEVEVVFYSNSWFEKEDEGFSVCGEQLSPITVFGEEGLKNLLLVRFKPVSRVPRK